jgi:UDP-N-acetylmuramoyl-L-alanyl-D-glutamate--2,6-diaminopimelate ligase
MWGLDDKKGKALILNKDDENYSFYSSLAKCKVSTYSINKHSEIMAKKIDKSFHESKFSVLVNSNEYRIKTSLVGGFNIYNILAVFSAIKVLKKDLSSFIEFLKIYIPVNGRMNKIFYKNKTIIIDFAHTPSSVKNVLANVKQFTNNKICVVIGCGGNRDTEKRSEIGILSSEYADRVIFTTDNPRLEDPKKIILDMIKKITKDNYEIIYDRKEAITTALSGSNKDEVILILGKGNERTQIINGINHPFSDKEVVYEWIKNIENSYNKL